MKFVSPVLVILVVCVRFAFSEASGSGPGKSQLEILKHRWIERIETVNNFTEVGGSNAPTPKGRDGEPIKLVWKKQSVFSYQATVKNQTGKTIKGIIWNYVFKDIETGTELRRHVFLQPSQIVKTKIKVLNGLSLEPPTNLVKAEDLGKHQSVSYNESVEIRCIIFDDNSSWKDTNAPASVCEQLEKELKRIKKEREKIF